jgi:hypothetical protein
MSQGRRRGGPLRRVADWVRAQAAKEEHARLIVSLAALDQGSGGGPPGLMARQSARRPGQASAHDSLERLWALPAWSPTRRTGDASSEA